MRQTAYAKINLALHIRRRRADGYHEIETLFAFVDQGDELVFTPAEEDTLRIGGEFASALTGHPGNIVSRALSVLPRAGRFSVLLDKRLPVAAGLGGGSADAGAVFRAVEDAGGLPGDWHRRAVGLGADVPACVRSEPCLATGIGDVLQPVRNTMAGTPVLLVNPRLPLPTASVFAAWDGQDRGPLPAGDMETVARGGRNDLENPATGLCPAIADVRAALEGTDPWLVRMSGSGATCFALYRSPAARDAAHERLTRLHPGWWQLAGQLR
ncbi:4-(cytidine 5'-diphospho)-2-C-methyl-D-erythritol kinase [Erythrobacteraceae bacterium CFH 75059]|uniref:4-(cytidine 5'-diphospho)-2-C-methyl-D-erythritol kinase n=1 Tax=Qipengyuania thermophila TaxID=2509361 RepID=UPI00101F0E0D|nr:4-(cytidine 5'-diphospho)-2-C-methyl-D-erythritol kinase [Qipengyuania thermophila]TCD05323.1 4-(cytidine 5'-diphospho)-2-C-methyl-D-erythritol kinase [Erythrobacteraceae bacterium CFH 75059]